MKKKTIIWLHVIFWIVLAMILLSNMVLLPHSIPAEKYNYLRLIVNYGFLIIPVLFYTGYFFSLRLVNKKLTLLYVLVLLFLIYVALFFISKEVFAYAIVLIEFLWWIVFGVLSRLGIDWFQKQQNITLLKKENAESKLMALRNQINPHFLFNTLNNIDALIKQDQEKASQSLIKLSDIMRYMLNESSHDKVSLENELTYLENYVSLEQLRLKNPEFVHFNVSGNPVGKEIAPMLFIPFVENAFKHSINSKEKDGIKIYFVIEENRILFDCENKFNKQPTEKDASHGVGLETVHARLRMIYPKKHTLVIDDSTDIFNVHLEIILNEN